MTHSLVQVQRKEQRWKGAGPCSEVEEEQGGGGTRPPTHHLRGVHQSGGGKVQRLLHRLDVLAAHHGSLRVGELGHLSGSAAHGPVVTHVVVVVHAAAAVALAGTLLAAPRVVALQGRRDVGNGGKGKRHRLPLTHGRCAAAAGRHKGV
jgi:hypothetical protein